MKKNPKIAITGFALEANSFSPVSTREDFENPVGTKVPLLRS